MAVTHYEKIPANAPQSAVSPPWLAYPEIRFRSIGWRMGYGEHYSREFSRWFRALGAQERAQYAQDNPEPGEWAGYYARLQQR